MIGTDSGARGKGPMIGIDSGARGKGGFSLVELMIAVTIMALLGTVVLRVFLSADGMNRKAADLDKAVNLSVDAVERMKAENPTILWNTETLNRIFPDSIIDRLDEGWRIRLLFDNEWQLFSPVRSDWPSRSMVLILKPNPETGNGTTTVSVSVSETVTAAGVPIPEHGVADRKNTLFAMQAELPSACDTQGVAP